jgi:hypothetical protein
MPTRDFDAERRAKLIQGGLKTFILAGDEYTIRPAIDPDSLVDYEEIVANTNSRNVLEVLDRVFLDMVLPSQEEQYREARKRRLDYQGIGADGDMREIAASTVKVIDPNTLVEVIAWIVEQVTGRPFSWPDGSPGSPVSNGTSGMASSPSQELTPPPSTSAVS